MVVATVEDGCVPADPPGCFLATVTQRKAVAALATTMMARVNRLMRGLRAPWHSAIYWPRLRLTAP